MDVCEQTETVQFLERLLGAYSSVEKIATHASLIFLTPKKAYKLKRAVLFPYLDYSTPQRRHAACLSEFTLNRRTAPDLYIGVHTITREADGELVLDGTGQLVDAVVEMHRFDQDLLFDRMAQHGSLTPAIVSDLAGRIVAFHQGAPHSLDRGGAEGIARVLEINERALLATRFVGDEIAAPYSEKFQRALRHHWQRLEARRQSGKVRRCHGDLTLRNICLLQGAPTLFDCIEFDEDLATIDVLYDLAFLLMDLWHRDQRELANILLNRYLDASDETDGLSLVPFFMAIRAAVRAHVMAAQVEETRSDAAIGILAEARQYFELAQSLLEPAPPILLTVGGFSGTGKSTVASLLAPHIGAAPGARVLNSDRVRKQIHGVPAETHLSASAYGPDVSDQVYAALGLQAARTLESGSSVVVDAVFDRPGERERIERIAAEKKVPFRGYWLHAPEDLLISRVIARQHDPSDATAEVVRMQVTRACGQIDWVHLDASRPAYAIRDEILSSRPAR